MNSDKLMTSMTWLKNQRCEWAKKALLILLPKDWIVDFTIGKYDCILKIQTSKGEINYIIFKSEINGWFEGLNYQKPTSRGEEILVMISNMLIEAYNSRRPDLIQDVHS